MKMADSEVVKNARRQAEAHLRYYREMMEKKEGTAMKDELPPLPEPWDALQYDPDTGIFCWVKQRGPVKAGAIAGSRLGDYWAIRLGKKTLLAHRCAVYMMTGCWPEAGMTVDHIDGNKLNNTWVNLRVVPQAINNQNVRRATCGSKSGLIGAHWNNQDQRWQSGLSINGKRVHLGKFGTAEEAHAAYIRAKREHHPGCTI